MLDFFTKTLSGLTYVIVVILCIIIIFALIGVLDELKYKEVIDDLPKGNKGTNKEEVKQAVETTPSVVPQAIPTVPTQEQQPK